MQDRPRNNSNKWSTARPSVGNCRTDLEITQISGAQKGLVLGIAGQARDNSTSGAQKGLVLGIVREA